MNVVHVSRYGDKGAVIYSCLIGKCCQGLEEPLTRAL